MRRLKELSFEEKYELAEQSASEWKDFGKWGVVLIGIIYLLFW